MSCYGILLDPGPGDTLRFLHGFCQLLCEKDDSGIVFCTPAAYRNVCDLFNIVDCEIILIKCASLTAINQQLRNLSLSDIWYCYDIKYIDRQTKKLPGVITEGTNHNYYMIDRFENHKYMSGKIVSHLQVFKFPQEEKALLFLRNMSIRPERNMNSFLLKLIIELLNSNSIVYDVVGSGTGVFDDQLKQMQGNRLYITGYPSYLTQLKEYGRYRFAIGMNSGGLDLAIAAGSPSIRIGEFHQHYNWLGANYNDFLSSACTVNIASLSETNISNIGKHQLQQALHIVLNECENRIWWI